jgi:hypothetical protein
MSLVLSHSLRLHLMCTGQGWSRRNVSAMACYTLTPYILELTHMQPYPHQLDHTEPMHKSH